MVESFYGNPGFTTHSRLIFCTGFYASTHLWLYCYISYLYGSSKNHWHIDQAALERLFEEMDTDGSGTISFREIMVFCKKRGIKVGYGEIIAFMKHFEGAEVY